MRLALLVALACTASGCATIVRGSTDTVTVRSDQDSAFVFVDGLAAGVAPAELQMRRSQDHQVEIIREGYRVGHARVENAFNPAVAAGSFLIGSLSGLAVDVSTGAVYDLDPGTLWIPLVRDSTGDDADYVAQRVRQAQQAALDGFAGADPMRRRDAPWVTAQVATGIYVGGTPEDGRSDGTGGFGASLLAGVRDEGYSARLSATASSGFLFDNSERWELAALFGVVGEAGGGRVRFGLATGPGLAGGRESNACVFFCDSGAPEGERRKLPTRVGLSALGELYAFVTPQIGLGLQVPVNFRLGDTLGGVMLGWKFEGL